MSDEKRRIVFTKHAYTRMNECRLDPKKAWWLVGHAEPEKLVHQGEYKREKYNGNDGVSYLRNGSIVFTVVDKADGKTGEPIRLVITLTDQRVTARI